MSICVSECVLRSWRWRASPLQTTCAYFMVSSTSCSMWAINLSPAISKQCSNQWEIISANRWASLSISPSLYLSCCPICIPFSQHPSLSSSLLSHFCCLSVFATHSFTRPPPPLLLVFPPALSAPQHLL